MLQKFLAFLVDRHGVTGIEYGFILGGVGLSLVTGAFMFGDDFTAMLGAFNLDIDSGSTIQ